MPSPVGDKTFYENFDTEEYAEYLPVDEAQRTALINLINEKSFGSKCRMDVLEQIRKTSTYLGQLRSKLEEFAVTTPRVGRNGSGKGRSAVQMAPREHLRTYLESASEEVLRGMAKALNVSYSSFMEGGQQDKVGLIEAMLDEASE